MKDVTIQDCEAGCGHRYCKDHISWSDDLSIWICDKCLRRKYGLRRGQPFPRAVEATA